MNLDEYNSQILKPMVDRFKQIVGSELQNFLKDYEPPTRWQKFKRFWKDKVQRCKDIWTIVTGGDIHENCER